MEAFLPIIIMCLVAILAIIAFFVGVWCIKKIGDLKRDTGVLFEDFDRALENQKKQMAQMLVASVNFEKKLKELNFQIEELKNTINEITLNTQDSESKLYTRAKKMIQLGAGIDEVITECELPKAEVEMLFSVLGKNIGSSGIENSGFNKNREKDSLISNKANLDFNNKELLKNDKTNESIPKEAEGLAELFKINK